jgi:hypothetical protein
MSDNTVNVVGIVTSALAIMYLITQVSSCFPLVEYRNCIEQNKGSAKCELILGGGQ